MFKSSFATIFSVSPFKTIQEHMQISYECAACLGSFFEKTYTQNWSEAETIKKEINSLENKADTIKGNIRVKLPTSLFLPVPRQDLLDLLSIQDGIANKSKDIAGIVFGRKSKIPEELQSEFKEYLHSCIGSVEQALHAVKELDNLLETGFRGQQIEVIYGFITKVEELENLTDKQQIIIRHKLFDLESQLMKNGSFSAVDIMFFYDTIKQLGDLANKAEQVCHRLILLIAK